MDKALIQSAKDNIKHHRAIYSDFPVSAAIRMKDGTIIHGINIENAAYGLSMCAERSALFSAYSQGYTKEDIKEMALTTPKPYHVTPCGSCRQVMSELMGPDVPLVMSASNGETKTLRNRDLLPYAFTEGDL
ncbi:MAG: cytidine deaminase [Bacillota bacterium]